MRNFARFSLFCECGPGGLLVLGPKPDGPKRTIFDVWCSDPYSVLHENEQVFASRYKLVLPSEEELRAELERERNQLATLTDSDQS
jgi:hypothetical protein